MNRRFFLTGATALGLAAATTAACTTTEDRAGAPTSATPAAGSTSFDRIVLQSADGTAFALHSTGSGDLVVIHPSLARGAADFDVVAGLIAQQGFRVISFDPRGCGATRNGRPDAKLTLDDLAADVRLIIDTFGGGRAHLIGHDFGNRVMRRLAVLTPGAARSITLWGAGSGEPSKDAVAVLTSVIGARTPVPAFEEAVTRGFFAPGNDPSVWYTGWYEAGGCSRARPRGRPRRRPTRAAAPRRCSSCKADRTSSRRPRSPRLLRGSWATAPPGS
ncbi:hypothetical protein AXK60_16955 [Tsukamurella pseudospumae]|uniref:AB hydrolase-1 domain-containing protein n=1 Tax=Tsukamurella pseudospumae TaxID=239498 RepID=A0A137ZZ86_9ACTN|nr:alpha/beta fold hydrolase [Tsukamurella pseudospumae]KXP03508.1 hypothetical protein AXK60_16955 [Tsukamurella pseudospumae]